MKINIEFNKDQLESMGDEIHNTGGRYSSVTDQEALDRLNKAKQFKAIRTYLFQSDNEDFDGAERDMERERESAREDYSCNAEYAASY